MKILAIAALLYSLPTIPITAPAAHLDQPKVAAAAKAANRGGRWYLAETGHAVYCYGPVMTVRPPEGGMQKVATYCRGDQPIVPLHD